MVSSSNDSMNSIKDQRTSPNFSQMLQNTGDNIKKAVFQLHQLTGKTNYTKVNKFASIEAKAGVTHYVKVMV